MFLVQHDKKQRLFDFNLFLFTRQIGWVGWGSSYDIMVHEVETTDDDGVNGRIRAVHLSKWQYKNIILYNHSSLSHTMCPFLFPGLSYVLGHVSTLNYLGSQGMLLYFNKY